MFIASSIRCCPAPEKDTYPVGDNGAEACFDETGKGYQAEEIEMPARRAGTVHLGVLTTPFADISPDEAETSSAVRQSRLAKVDSGRGQHTELSIAGAHFVYSLRQLRNSTDLVDCRGFI